MIQIKVLMFGWEFPPLVSGGLGTACFGLTEAMSKLNDIELTFLAPRTAKRIEKNLNVISAHETPIKKATTRDYIKRYIEIESEIYPYTTDKEFWEKSKNIPGKQLIRTQKNGTIDFQGGYGFNLREEVFQFSIAARELAIKESFQIIHAHDWLTFPAALSVKKETNKPLIVHIHSTEFDRNSNHINASVYSIEKEGMENADAIIAVSNYTRKIIIEKYNISPEKVFIIHNGVRPISAQNKSSYQKDFKEHLITYMGRITSQKGPEYFLEAANKIMQKKKNVRFVMAGKGDLLNTMIEKAARLNITDRFHFTGYINDQEVYDLFSISDAFVMPSVSEPFGIAALEAMQWGVPTIVSDRSGVSEIAKNIITYRFNSTNELANSIIRIIEDDKLRLRLGMEGKKEAAKLNWDHPTREVRSLYRKLLRTTDS